MKMNYFKEDIKHKFSIKTKYLSMETNSDIRIALLLDIIIIRVGRAAIFRA